MSNYWGRQGTDGDGIWENWERSVARRRAWWSNLGLRADDSYSSIAKKQRELRPAIRCARIPGRPRAARPAGRPSPRPQECVVSHHVPSTRDAQQMVVGSLSNMAKWRGWWHIGKIDAFCLKGCGFESSSSHVTDLGQVHNSELPVAFRSETPAQYPCCVRGRFWVGLVVDLKRRYRIIMNEWMNEWMNIMCSCSRNIVSWSIAHDVLYLTSLLLYNYSECCGSRELNSKWNYGIFV